MKELKKQAVLGALVVAGLFLFIMLCSEIDAPVWVIIAVKVINAAALLLVGYIGKVLDAHGMLPNMEDE